MVRKHGFISYVSIEVTWGLKAKSLNVEAARVFVRLYLDYILEA